MENKWTKKIDRLERENRELKKRKKLDHIKKYVLEEGYSNKHLAAIEKIVFSINEDEETEQKILKFADTLGEGE